MLSHNTLSFKLKLILSDKRSNDNVFECKFCLPKQHLNCHQKKHQRIVLNTFNNDDCRKHFVLR